MDETAASLQTRICDANPVSVALLQLETPSTKTRADSASPPDEGGSAQPVLRGNAGAMREDEPHWRGWFVGDFMSHPSLRSSSVEVKWGVHTAGEARTEWSGGSYTTLAMLIKGRERLIFPDEVIRNYVLFV